MKKYVYCAIFTQTDEGVAVEFPDIFGGVTCGEDFDDAVFMAKDLLRLMLSTAPAQCESPLSKEEMEKMFPGEKIVEIEVEI